MPYSENGEYIPYSTALLAANSKAQALADKVGLLCRSEYSTPAQIASAEDELDSAIAELEILSDKEHQALISLGVKTYIDIS